MEYLKIKNTGLLDLRLIYLMGGTTKADDKFKIGQFGTGLKYTLAYLLRNNFVFHVFIGGKEVKITTQKETIRDVEFNIICIDGQKTSITTMVGKKWKGWMIVRELWCNAIDEEGGEYCVTEEINPEENTTEFYIQNVGDIQSTVDNWQKYFIHGVEKIQDHENFALYPGGDTMRFYKNGVLIKEQDGEKSVFAYDIKNANINELREFNGAMSAEVSRILPFFDKKAAEIFINNIKGCYEEDMDYEWWTNKYSDGWKEAIGNAKVIDYETYDRLKEREPHIEHTPCVRVNKGLFKKLVAEFPSISMLRLSDKMNSFFETYSDVFHDKIKKCQRLLETVGYFIDPELKILTGVFGCPKTKGEIHFDDKEIRLSQDLEVMSDSELIVVLIEENEHYKTGFSDMTREFQTHFIKLYSNLLLKSVNVLI